VQETAEKIIRNLFSSARAWERFEWNDLLSIISLRIWKFSWNCRKKIYIGEYIKIADNLLTAEKYEICLSKEKESRI